MYLGIGLRVTRKELGVLVEGFFMRICIRIARRKPERTGLRIILMQTLAALNCHLNRGNEGEDDSWNLHLVIRWTLMAKVERRNTAEELVHLLFSPLNRSSNNIDNLRFF